MLRKYIAIALAIVAFSSFEWRNTEVYVVQSSSVSFVSTASFGKIKGISDKLTGSLDTKKRSFEFKLPACSFEGFFNPTQKKHYCDKFVEGPKFPDMGFKGKIIEDIDLTTPGTHTVRGKGMFLLHGVEIERIIDVTLNVKDGQITVDSKFPVPVEDHGIKVSKMNSLSMAKVIDVVVKIVMKPS
jgi:hypothetical protein